MSNNWSYEDLPTPESRQDYVNLVEEVFAQREAWVSTPGWTKIGENNGNTLETMGIEGSKFLIYRTTGILKNVDIEAVAKLSYNSTFDEKKRVFSDLISQNITRNQDEIVVTLSRFDTPFGVTNREFLALRALRQYNDGSYLIVIQSINSESVPFESGFVRGTTNCALKLEPINNNEVRITTINHVDPKGWVLPSLTKSFKGKQYQTIENIQKVYGK